MDLKNEKSIQMLASSEHSMALSFMLTGRLGVNGSIMIASLEIGFAIGLLVHHDDNIMALYFT